MTVPPPKGPAHRAYWAAKAEGDALGMQRAMLAHAADEIARSKRLTPKIREFCSNWAAGFHMVLVGAILFGLFALGSGVAGVVLYGVLICVPAELIFRDARPEYYLFHVFVISITIFGIEMIGRSKHLIVTSMIKKDIGK